MSVADMGRLPVRVLAWLAIILLTLWLVFFGGGWQGIYTSSLRLTSVALAAAALATWAVVARSHPEWRPRSALTPAIAVALTSLTVSTLLSRFPRISVEYLGYAIVLSALYLLLVRVLTNRARIAGGL